jgi:hypothetical protein
MYGGKRVTVCSSMGVSNYAFYPGDFLCKVVRTIWYGMYKNEGNNPK